MVVEATTALFCRGATTPLRACARAQFLERGEIFSNAGGVEYNNPVVDGLAIIDDAGNRPAPGSGPLNARGNLVGGSTHVQ